MRENTAKPICFPPISSANEVKEMERRRKELKIIVTTGLGSDIDRYVSQSPTLVKQITKLKGKDWKIVWGAAGGGTTTQHKYLRIQDDRVIIDSQFNTRKSQDIAYVTSTLAHEVGHAFFYEEPNYSSYKKCIESMMVGGGSEADALLNQIKVRQEILQAICIDIFEEGNEYPWMKKDFVDIYNQGLRMNDMKTAKRTIAELYSKQRTSNTKQTYEEYYDESCKQRVKE